MVKAIVAVLLLTPALAALAADYPEAQISNGVLAVKLLPPDAQTGYYRGTRFDWSGRFPACNIKGHEYFGNGSNTTIRRFTMPSWARWRSS